ncbi:unnamed protein product [Didymodactylos carnosus]|uniref:Uncharacterized protein n=1 Tax=Didymodactylos carnosus TaxID=1234261 RepID=A0A8S2IGN3_9BILA|nr:unnamed protein product [Didymodactylos carnosus]CAF3752973.1 unnamed protein product [Didymodactylos carnosus]
MNHLIPLQNSTLYMNLSDFTSNTANYEDIPSTHSMIPLDILSISKPNCSIEIKNCTKSVLSMHVVNSHCCGRSDTYDRTTMNDEQDEPILSKYFVSQLTCTLNGTNFGGCCERKQEQFKEIENKDRNTNLLSNRSY